MTTFVTLAAHWSPGQSPPSPTGTAAWPCRPGVRLPETVVAFAGAGRASIETVIAFAGEKWVFLVHFSGAEVMPVSRLPCWGRAVVLLVSTSPCCRTSCAIFVALRGLVRARMRKSSPCGTVVIVQVRKSSPSTRKMAQNGWYMARWANFFAETRLGGVCRASFFAEMRLEGPCRASFDAMRSRQLGPSTGTLNPSMRS